MIHTFRRSGGAEELARELEGLGARAVVTRAHLGSPEGVRTVVEACAEAGPVRSIIWAAASAVMRPLGELSRRHLRWSWEVSTLPVLEMALELRPESLVLLSSPASERVVPGYGAAAAAKASLEALARYMAVELAPGTRVNVLSVGLVETP